MILLAVGVAIGLGAAVAFARAMRSLVFNVTPLDPVTFVTMPMLLAAADALASYLPSRRAALVDPVETLRAE
jgi:ABC-type lipoprotein release transport system permease subunit